MMDKFVRILEKDEWVIDYDKENVTIDHIEFFPCHLASLPVAVNINCHAARHAEIEL